MPPKITNLHRLNNILIYTTVYIIIYTAAYWHSVCHEGSKFTLYSPEIRLREMHYDDLIK